MMNDPHKNHVGGCGNPHAKLVIVGEAPSFIEIQTGIPFSGASGKELDRLLSDSGINRNDCWITNICKYPIPEQEKEGRKIPFAVRAKLAGINLDEQLNELRFELSQIRPNAILALGGSALWGTTGKDKISDWRGSILTGMGSKVIPTYHPAHLLHTKGEISGYWARQVMIFDFRRAFLQSKFGELILPKRNLHIIKSSYELQDYIKRYEKFDKPSVDIEALGCIPVCIGLAFTPDEGITVPLWNVNDISQIPTSDLSSCWILLSNLLSNSEVVGQNFGYDRDKIRRLGFTIKRLASDTMLKAFVINPELPKNLAFNQSIYTEEPFYKNEGMYEGSLNDLFLGCARDSCVTKEIDLAMDPDLDELQLRPYYENFILPLHDLYAEIEQTGLRRSEPRRLELIKKYVEWDERVNFELFQLTNKVINTGSWKQVDELLYTDLKIPRRKGTGEEILTQLLNNVVKDKGRRRIIDLILEDRRVKKTLGTYLLNPSDFDGRMKTSFFLCLETGRSSTQQLEPPIRPQIEVIEEGKKKKRSIGCAFQTMTKHGDIGDDIREQYVVDEGEIFIQADSAQAEARVVFLLADDEEALELIDSIDYHALTATWFFGGRIDDYDKKIIGYETPIRFAGKTLRHACHLGASKRRAAIEVNTQARKYKIDITISELLADQAIKTFHKRQPKIKQVFHNQIIEQINKTRSLTAPLPYGIDAPFGGKRTFFERWSEDLFRQAFSYIPQRAVSENTKAAALRVKKRARWIKIMLESHDALLTSVPIDRGNEAASLLKEEMEKPINFSTCSLPRRNLIIPCEIEFGFDYKNLSKFKNDELRIDGRDTKTA